MDDDKAIYYPNAWFRKWEYFTQMMVKSTKVYTIAEKVQLTAMYLI